MHGFGSTDSNPVAQPTLSPHLEDSFTMSFTRGSVRYRIERRVISDMLLAVAAPGGVWCCGSQLFCFFLTASTQDESPVQQKVQEIPETSLDTFSFGYPHQRHHWSTWIPDGTRHPPQG